MTFRKFETFVIITVIAVIGVIYALTQKPLEPVSIQDPNQSIVSDTELSQLPDQGTAQTSVRYNGQDGKNAMELLKASHQVETKDYAGLGEFVTGIDGVDSDSTTFWSFYVNGTQSTVGASQYVTKNSDVIEWKLEEIIN
ncbi:MAG TPA: DUF4430 domain-containing protein [Verrucomicrobiae bacterium]|nr:DUF4430 domain-containing protein [Verrucomicrobiae bacterium]